MSERLLVLVACFSLSTCTVFDNEKLDFGFIVIKNFSLEDLQKKGLPSKITDVWMYANDQFLGVYPLPNKIPIPLNGDDIRLSIRPGIKPNGLKEASEEYPFFTAMDTIVKLTRNMTLEINPRIKYKSNCKFDFIEDFELNNIFTVGLGNSAQNPCLKRISGTGTFGSFGGVIDLDSNRKQCEMTHFTSFTNKNNLLGKVFLETDYKCNEKFLVGTILQKGSQLIKSYDIVVLESDEWNRIYIDLTDKISKTDVQNYQIAISSILDESKKSKASIHFDNMRLIHF